MTKNELYWNAKDKLKKRVLDAVHHLSLEGLEAVADKLEEIGIEIRKENA